jgi:hypothetical protein
MHICRIESMMVYSWADSWRPKGLMWALVEGKGCGLGGWGEVFKRGKLQWWAKAF